MKIIKRTLLLLVISLMFFTSKVFALNNLTIETKEYDKYTNVLSIGGSSSFDEVMVSVFDGNDLLAFKTVTAENQEYSATFRITFTENKTITIKVGDINSNDYEIATLNVEKSIIPDRSNKITDDQGNSLTILDTLKKFELDDTLKIEIKTEFDPNNEGEQSIINLIKRNLGSKRVFVGIMLVDVINNEESVELEETNKGYRLFLNIEEEDLESFTAPYAVRILDNVEFTFEKPIALKYNYNEEGAILDLNNIGIYVLYDDISIHYNFLDNTENQTYNLKKDGILKLRIDADYDKFLAVYVDDELVDPKNYTSESGSTIIKFKKDYMQSLSVGDHSIKIDFEDGEANTTVTIISDSKNPLTGDNIIKYLIVMMISLLAILKTLNYLKKCK